MAEPALEEWWGTRASVEAEITLALASESALARIILQDGEPVGYAHAVDLSLWRQELPPELEAGTWDIGLFVAPLEQRVEGTEQALALLVGEVFATTLAIACCSLVSIRNEAAARIFERAGFRWSRIWQDRQSGPAWVMVRARPI